MTRTRTYVWPFMAPSWSVGSVATSLLFATFRHIVPTEAVVMPPRWERIGADVLPWEETAAREGGVDRPGEQAHARP
ncbi:hypothetical protein ADL33_18500 [Streptomyces sp. NRRL WC-3604]|nr:hypothetical protein ADL33_18500 [Streptomyces sp. NRRL WC-3604]